MNIEVNLIAVVLAAVAAMIVGGVWYAPGFLGDKWKALVKLDEKKAKKEAPKAMGMMFVLALVTAYILAHATYLYAQFYSDVTFMGAALSTAFWAWLGFGFYSLASNYIFEQRPSKLLLINTGNQLVTFLAMGLVIGWIGF